jgi:hypothetical protein
MRSTQLRWSPSQRQKASKVSGAAVELEGGMPAPYGFSAGDESREIVARSGRSCDQEEGEAS